MYQIKIVQWLLNARTIWGARENTSQLWHNSYKQKKGEKRIKCVEKRKNEESREYTMSVWKR